MCLPVAHRPQLPQAPVHMHTHSWCTSAHLCIHTPRAHSCWASGSQCPCIQPHAHSGRIPLLTLLLHAALQALAQAAGLALPPGLLGDLAGALPEGASQAGVPFHGPPVREERAKGRPWRNGQGAPDPTSLSPCPVPIPGTLATPSVGLPLPLIWVRFIGKERRGLFSLPPGLGFPQGPEVAGGGKQVKIFPAVFTLCFPHALVAALSCHTVWDASAPGPRPSSLPHPHPLLFCPCSWVPQRRTLAVFLWRWPLPGFLLLRQGSPKKPHPRSLRNIRSPHSRFWGQRQLEEG